MTIQKISESEASQLVLDSYFMNIHKTSCSRCDSGEQYCDIFEVWVHPTKTRITGFKQLRRLATPDLKDLPMEYMELPERQLPICSDCVTSYKSGNTDATPISNVIEWTETLKRKYAPPAKAEAKASAGTKDIPSLDDL